MDESVGLSDRASRLQLEASWQTLIGDEFEKPYMQTLSAFLRREIKAGRRIFPPGKEMLAALNDTPVEKVKVVIIGQDPYHGPGQAHGLCFSVRSGTRVPPSLANIFKEINSDLAPEGQLDGARGCLTGWAKQGVLLLNSVLSVEQSRAASHQGKGWEGFTDAIVANLSAARPGLVFMLWGAYAQKKGAMVDQAQHLVLSSPHPSPLSAHRGFLGNRHFSQANCYLEAAGKTPVDWFAVE